MTHEKAIEANCLMSKLKDACMAALAMLLIILFPNMDDV